MSCGIPTRVEILNSIGTSACLRGRAMTWGGNLLVKARDSQRSWKVLVQDEIATIPKKEVISAQKEEQMDEAIQTLSAPERKEAAVRAAIEKTQRTPTIEQEIDLINNLSAPQNQEIAPDIDEELQTL